MDGKRLIEKIKLRNILSFGDKGEEIELQPLNIIIGQNASGKSNLVDVINLIKAALNIESAEYISKNGGINEWIWKGNKKKDISEIHVLTKTPVTKDIFTYDFKFSEFEQRIIIFEDQIKDLSEQVLVDRTKEDWNNEVTPTLLRTMLPFYILLKLRSYANLETNRSSDIRKPQLPDALNDFLEEDGSNLALVLNDLEHRGNIKDKIVENLRKFHSRIKDYSVRILGGTVQLFIREEGLERPISAMRLSDGTLRYLCLLAILCHPEPPPLICIEEPETGLHPDILPTIAELMKEAAQRTQLIVTTHSDILVSAFSDMPEAVLVCEKDEDGTHFTRLEADKLKAWLEEYTLGEVWMRGGIGGTRW
jgi:predicted ATPase